MAGESEFFRQRFGRRGRASRRCDSLARGEALLAPAVTRSVIEEFTRIPQSRSETTPVEVSELTPREREVLELLIRGLSNTEICRSLVISDATARPMWLGSCRNLACATGSKS